MNTIFHLRYGVFVALIVAMLAALGCVAKTTVAPQAEAPKKVKLASNLTLDVDGDHRRVLFDAEVTDHPAYGGQVYFEFFVTQKGSEKSYEAMLEADVDAWELYKALKQAKAEPGSPYEADPYRPPTGQMLKIKLKYERDGQQVIVPAQSWIRTKDGRTPSFDWVFTGSQFYEDERHPDRKRVFLAQATGALVSVANLESTLIDVNIRSSRTPSEMELTYNIENMPPAKTKVTVILEPVGEFKKHK
jgi:hypothetical protein